MGGLHDYVALSSRELGDMLDMSQQSASKRILELLDGKLIERDLGAPGDSASASPPRASDMLRKEYIEYQKIFEMKDELVIKGTRHRGHGRGPVLRDATGLHGAVPRRSSVSNRTRARSTSSCYRPSITSWTRCATDGRSTSRASSATDVRSVTCTASRPASRTSSAPSSCRPARTTRTSWR